ncbi:MAG: hypothetical protein GX323_03120 [Clostridiales bacterium]|nr:hypothetical protein [Clostridiales bacterium]
MCNCGFNRCRCPRRGTGVGPGYGNRPGYGQRPGTRPGCGQRPNRCRRDNVGGAPCPYRTPRAWQDPRYGSSGRR